MQNRSETVSSAEAHAEALMDHACAGPKTVFTNVDGRKCIQEQCVFCFRRVGGALKPCLDVFGAGVPGHEHEQTSSLSVRELLERHKRLAAFLELQECGTTTVWFKPIGDGDPLQAMRTRLWHEQRDERLKRPDWQLLRIRAIERAKGACELCGTPTTKFDVHHLNYKRYGHEWPEDLAAVCHPCHFNKLHHDKR